MSFFNAVKKVQLRGETALLDREIKARQSKFGVQLYELLMTLERSKSTFATAIQTPSIFHADESQIKEPFEACRADIKPLKDKKEAKEREAIDFRMEANRERAPPSRSHRKALEKAGTWVSNTGSEAKLAVQIKLFERKIQQRKGQFGVDVFAIFDQEKRSCSPSTGSSTQNGVAQCLLKLSKSEQEIQDCIDRAKQDVAMIRRRRGDKERKIKYLDESMAL